MVTEFLRFLVNAVLIGVLSDLFFSPSHRLMHKFFYDKHNSIHHKYQPNELTALVVYYAGAWNTFLMGGSITLGGMLCDVLLKRYPLLKAGIECDSPVGHLQYSLFARSRYSRQRLTTSLSTIWTTFCRLPSCAPSISSSQLRLHLRNRRSVGSGLWRNDCPATKQLPCSKQT
jgi:hypothetical protein